MKVLVTGHTGFIGKNLFEFLRKNSVEATGYSRSAGNDILDMSQVLNATRDVDLVYHLAAYSKPDESFVRPLETFQTNIVGTLNILEACRKRNFSLIYVSSSAIYGDSEVPIEENFALNPPNPYAASKASADRICYCYWKAYGLDIKILRLFNPYGPYQQMDKVIPKFCFQAMMDLPITIYGDGLDSRDYTYVEDVVGALWMSRALAGGQVINICTGVETTVLELARKILDFVGSNSGIEFVEHPRSFRGIRRQVGCPRKAERLMGWRAKYTLDRGLVKTIDWLRRICKSGQTPTPH